MNKEVIIPGKIYYATFKNRPNRFLVNLIPDGTNTIEPAFLHDPGRMKELLVPNARLLIRKPINSNKRKTKWDILAVEYNNLIVTINSSFPNYIAKHALQNKWIKELIDYDYVRSEVTIGSSRLDFQLENKLNECYVEVKGVTLVENQRALFPDAPTSRGTRHLKELISLKNKGNRAIVLFFCMRKDANVFSPNKKTDPLFSEQLRLAYDSGVEILVYKAIPIIRNNLLTIHLDTKLNLEL